MSPEALSPWRLSSPALRSGSDQETGGRGHPFPSCWASLHITLGLSHQDPAQGCSHPAPRGARGTQSPAERSRWGVLWAAGGNDIPSEMGRFCSGRPEKSQGQRGEVMAAVSGVILPLHLRGPLSDSPFLFRSRESGNTHLRRLPSCPASPRAAARRDLGFSWPCPVALGTSGGNLLILPFEQAGFESLNPRG